MWLVGTGPRRSAVADMVESKNAPITFDYFGCFTQENPFDERPSRRTRHSAKRTARRGVTVCVTACPRRKARSSPSSVERRTTGERPEDQPRCRSVPTRASGACRASKLLSRKARSTCPCSTRSTGRRNPEESRNMSSPPSEVRAASSPRALFTRHAPFSRRSRASSEITRNTTAYKT